MNTNRKWELCFVQIISFENISSPALSLRFWYVCHCFILSQYLYIHFYQKHTHACIVNMFNLIYPDMWFLVNQLKLNDFCSPSLANVGLYSMCFYVFPSFYSNFTHFPSITLCRGNILLSGSNLGVSIILSFLNCLSASLCLSWSQHDWKLHICHGMRYLRTWVCLILHFIRFAVGPNQQPSG